ENGTCLLYSGGQFESAKQSFLCLFPFDFIWIQNNTQWKANLNPYSRIELSLPNPWDALKKLLPPPSHHLPYPEWMGFLSYEMGAFSDREKKLPYHGSQMPDAYLQRCAVVICVDHQTNLGKVLIADQAFYVLPDEQLEWVQRFSNKNEWIELA